MGILNALITDKSDSPIIRGMPNPLEYLPIKYVVYTDSSIYFTGSPKKVCTTLYKLKYSSKYVDLAQLVSLSSCIA